MAVSTADWMADLWEFRAVDEMVDKLECELVASMECFAVDMSVDMWAV
jgi:hypothetical protein